MPKFILMPVLLCLISINAVADIYLDQAIKIGNYLLSIAEEEGDGYKWRVSDIHPNWYSTALANGVTGIAGFLADLYVVTSDTKFLDAAEKGAQYLIDVAVKDDIGYRWHYYDFVNWESTDKLGGAAGIGEFFLKLYQVTNDQRYLDVAAEAIKWLETIKYTDGDKCYWPIDATVENPDFWTGWYHGAAGIGDFYLQMYLETGNNAYLEGAKGAANWLISIAKQPETNQYAWTRKSIETDLLDIFCNGTAGILHFLSLLVKTCDQSQYLGAAGMVGNRMIDIAQPMLGGYLWHYTNMYCHGDPSAIDVLLELADLADWGDDSYYQYATGGVTYMKAIKQTVSEDIIKYGYAFTDTNYYYTSLMRGNAGVGWAFLHYYEYTHDAELITLAKQIANWLISQNQSDNLEHAYWVHYIGEYDPEEPPAVETGWYEGAAGIGEFFIELAKYTNTNNINDELNITCYPNPVKDILFLNESIRNDSKIQIHNLLGQVVLETAIGNNLSINLAHLPSGVYYLCIQQPNLPYQTLRIVKINANR